MGYVLGEIIVPLILALLLGVIIGYLLWGFRRKKVTYSEWETETSVAKSGTAPAAAGTHTVIDLRGDLETANARIAELEAELAGVGAGAGGAGAVAGFAAMPAGDAEESDARPYGEGSLAPLADGSNPAGYPIKGNVDSMLYHRPDSRNYGATIAEVWFDTPQRAETAGFSLANTHPKNSTWSATADPAVHPYGEGSHAPLDDNSAPNGYTIKGNVDSMLYHRPDSRNYGATIAEVWFDTPQRAEAAGFGLANTHPKG